MLHKLTKEDWTLLNDSFSIMKRTEIAVSIFTILPAWKAKNYDGSPSGWLEGTQEGDKLVLQEIVFESNRLKYINHWGKLN